MTHESKDVLKRCHLMKSESEGGARDVVTLDSAVGNTGSFSAGERQLIALARAMLRRSKVIIMDEATSQIDNDLDEKVSFASTSIGSRSFNRVVTSLEFLFHQLFAVDIACIRDERCEDELGSSQLHFRDKA